MADKSALDEELKRLRAEVAEAKKTRVAQPDTHDSLLLDGIVRKLENPVVYAGFSR